MTTEAAEPANAAADVLVTEAESAEPDRATSDVVSVEPDRATLTRRLPRLNLGLDRFSGLYVWTLIILVFGIWLPDTFLTSYNFQIIAGDQAITAMLALGLIIPLAAGVFDLSCAATLGFAVTVVTWLLKEGFNPVLAILITLACGAFIGFVNGLVVVRLNVDSFIGTLGMSSILAAGAYWVTNGEQIVNTFSKSFLDAGSTRLWGVSLPFYYMLLLAAILYVIVDHTPVGRYLYAAGGNPQAARLAGMRVGRVVWGSLITSATLAALTGVILAAKLGSASQDVGPPYLLQAFSAVFLGSTQIKAGRMNVLGTLVAIYLLATGVKGLQLGGSPSYVNSLFNGLALIIAVALAARTYRRK
ncbi:ABC transporter permease [Frankia sp. Cppng1_Ct_nod]|uniref:ABC transporter permease n=1 Tax=Frankia sp. Cppng1_Ct_nod TaxID=2897162 RepID=UPI00104139B9|nr:ABC transporter permease [Frankia sp. Cppng1_Ct_nod]